LFSTTNERIKEEDDEEDDRLGEPHQGLPVRRLFGGHLLCGWFYSLALSLNKTSKYTLKDFFVLYSFYLPN
jgi:hypothetical protein